MGVVVIRLPAASNSQGNLLPDLTPLLDVIFIVLVFFLLTAQTPLLELPLQLPQSREALPTASAGSGERMQIQLSVEGNWRFNGTPQTDFSALRTELTAAFAADSAAGLDLALDRQAPLSAFIDLMALLQQQGIQDSRILLEANHETP
ncbi:MAG: biopolymer transporter ExbD [Pseudomonas sp.]|uniref:ExbD/TolR family protein n=1 Tax=Pseudomonas sp. TaxID=306 RepID=UPI002727F0C8|nr:biopolymer transporter ExbD [Pseudomonas sp.]MDO9619339.1 biopolymer transporter ExbD [Pseudomonas sp.]MDP2446041.1 biopolymer transporter ExbD [Pseudomonas sp.]